MARRRGFNLLSLVMTPLKNRLSVVHIDELMRVGLLGPSIKGFQGDVLDVLKEWLEGSKGGRYLGKIKAPLPSQNPIDMSIRDFNIKDFQ